MATLRSLTIQNFKGIKDPVKIDFRPITLLFGPNSAGKSTIIQALVYAREIFVNRNPDPHQCEVHGEQLDLGGFCSLVHGHDLSLSISLELELFLGTQEVEQVTINADGTRTSRRVIKKAELPENLDDDYLETMSIGFNEYPFDYLDCARAQTLSAKVSIAWDERRLRPFVESYNVAIDGEPFCKIQEFGPTHYIGRKMEIVRTKNLLQERDIKAMTMEFLQHPNIKKLPVEIRAQVNFEHSIFNVQKEELGKSINLLDGLADSLLKEPEECHLLKEHPIGAPSGVWISNDGTALPNWENPISLGTDKEDLKPTERLFLTVLFDELLYRTIVGPGRLVRDLLRDLRCLGPLRPIPPRLLEQGQIAHEKVARPGLSIWEELFGVDEKTLGAINDWMGPKRLNVGYAIDRKEYREFDSNRLKAFDVGQPGDRSKIIDEVRKKPERIRVSLCQEHSGMELSFRDVGTGISQVMPVVIATLISRDQIVAIEQPELHIHPALQVSLADLFISRIQDEKAPLFLLETHSEHLVLRMLRRIRETSENKLPSGAPSLKPDQVNVLYIEPDNGTVRVLPLRIDETGDFIDRWPRGFFAERVKELYGE